jgi:Highly conserved protein containing a thioredoxin domain
MISFRYSVLQTVIALVIAVCPGALYAQPKNANRSFDLPAEELLQDAARQYNWLSKQVPADSFPKTTDQDGRLVFSASHWWCSGFYPGTLFYLYEATGNQQLKDEAIKKLRPLAREQHNTWTHDVGFMMFNSYGHANRLFPSAAYKKVLVNSARSLATRFSDTTGCIRSWNGKPGEFLVIIDNMMNLELLFYATWATGDSSFYHMARRHANTTMKEHIRPDNSSYHVVNYDPVTGKPQRKYTRQGYSDQSAWARGQGWGLYGYTVMYRETKDRVYLDMANKIARFILDHPAFPADKIPYWDFHAPGIPNALRDASAGSLIASALLELAAYNESELREEYLETAEKALRTLASPEYKAAYKENGGFLLKHSVGFFAQNSEVDVPLSYADYYYVEALYRYQLWKTGKLIIGGRPAMRIIREDGRRLIGPVDQQRVREIARMLPDKPRAFGSPIGNRRVWDSLYRTGQFAAVIADAEEVRKSPLPPLTDEIYLSFFDGKDSETSKKLMTRRRLLFASMVWAECLINDGRFIPAIEAALHSLMQQKSWQFPAEDRTKTNFYGTQYTINLGSASYGQEIAQAIYLLGDKLKPETRRLAKESLYKFVFRPTLNAINDGGRTDIFGSLISTGNHNAATLAGVTAAALATIDDKQERATFVAIAEHYIQNYLLGFLDDGYCSEGLDYYNYGFEHFINLRESLLQATNGAIDIMKGGEKLKKIARFVPNLVIINGIYPAIGDCKQYPAPSSFILYYLGRCLNMTLSKNPVYRFNSKNLPPLSKVMQVFPNAATAAVAPHKQPAPPGIRSYFDQAGLLIVRPASGSSFRVGAAFKGGNNAEHHNHNDIGSYTIVVGKEMLMGDPGLATYTPKTFSPERYSAFKSINSYGHPVPKPADKLQAFGASSQATVIRSHFTDSADQFVLDIRSAYPDAGLQKLERAFTYHRSKRFIDVRDEFEFHQPQAFETVIITRGKWRQNGTHTIVISGEKEALKVTVDTGNWPFTIVSEVIDEGKGPYTRLAIRSAEPVKAGHVVLHYETLSATEKNNK